MGLHAFSRGRGDRSQRVSNPDGFAQTETAAFVLGSDQPGWFDDIDVFDGIGVWRADFDCTGVQVIRARFRLRGPLVALPSGGHWAILVLVNDVTKLTYDLPVNKTEDHFDFGVNVSKLVGVQKVEFLLRWLP